MAEEAPSVMAGWTARLWFAGIITVFCLVVIVYLIRWGESDNRLHESAMIWSWVTIIGVLGGFGIGAAIAPITEIWKR